MDEELLRVAKKQLLMQRINCGLLVALIVLLLAGGGAFLGNMNRMSDAMDDMTQKVEELDLDSLNGTIGTMQDVLKSAEQFSTAVDDMTEKVEGLGAWFTGLFGGNAQQ